ncbi:alpha-N-acetylgalactosaminide alpha-2,6-sialyltransferase 2-like [Acanthaster planci]|uniref:alpha-N-acetylgalactosaminide alpha-2,6-sialyltransferase n=1 Tax=Acanthaster planci TaxID=133434 RepID=A0A8B7Z597_ACAPL|nr:alpha-N-acetylgalactosaminide alpha-2,6-sialyltransferase 2-like [Acanthaster planci]
MSFALFSCKSAGHGGFVLKWVVRLVLATGLGVSCYALVTGISTLTRFPSIWERISFPTKEGRLRQWNVDKDDTGPSKGLLLKKESVQLANIDNRIQGIAFNQTYKDTLAEDLQRRDRLRPWNWRLSESHFIPDTQFLNYMTCPTSVRKKLLLESFVRYKYVPEIPLLMWSKHYSKEEYARLSHFHSIYGWEVANESVIASALSLLNTSSNTYMFDKDRSPGEDGCTSCAVIGNGGILNGSKMGKEIDAHDYVFRVNIAVTKGHEEDVGSKTSFYCAAFRSLSNSLISGRPYGFKVPPYQQGIRYIFFPKTRWAYMFLGAVLRGNAAPRNPEDGRLPPKFQTKLTAEDIKLVHPDFERYIRDRWINSTRRKNVQIYRPSTGAIMLLLALHTCDKVDAYGFAGSFEKYSEYYYDVAFTKHVSYLNHDSQKEKELWIKLHQLGIINLYTRD